MNLEMVDVWMSNIHFEVVGEGTPLLILHAMGHDHRAMRAWIEPVFEQVRGWKRYYIDLPAHGKSKIGSNIKTTDDQLQLLMNFINQELPNQTFALVGMSFGSYLAQGIRYLKKDSILGLCLLAPVLHRGPRTPLPKQVLAREESLLLELDEDQRTAFETLFVVQTRDTYAHFRDEIQPGRGLANREFLMSDWRANHYWLSFDPTPAEVVMDFPTLLLYGRQDTILSLDDSNSLFPLFPHATLGVIDGAGHMIQIERRSLVQSFFVDWLGRVGEAPYGKIQPHSK